MSTSPQPQLTKYNEHEPLLPSKSFINKNMLTSIEQVEELTGVAFDADNFVLGEMDVAMMVLEVIVSGSFAYAWAAFSVFFAAKGEVPYSHYSLFLASSAIGMLLGPSLLHSVDNVSFRNIFVGADATSSCLLSFFLIPFQGRFYFWCFLMFIIGVVGSVEGSIRMAYIGKLAGSRAMALRYIGVLEFAESLSFLLMFIPGLIISKMGFMWFIVITALYKVPMMWYWWYVSPYFTPNMLPLIEDALDEYEDSYDEIPNEEADFAERKILVYQESGDEEEPVEKRNDYDESSSSSDDEEEMTLKGYTWKERLRLLWRGKTLFLSAFSTGIAETAFVIGIGYYLGYHMGLTPFEIGLFSITFCAGMAFGLVILLPFEETLDPLTTASASQTLMAITLALFAVFYYNYMLHIVTLGLLAFAGGTFGSASQVLISYAPFEVFEGKDVILGTAMCASTYAIGTVIGSAMTPVVLYYPGFGTLSLVSASLMLVPGWLMLALRGR